jgi:hypothetical protein
VTKYCSADDIVTHSDYSVFSASTTKVIGLFPTIVKDEKGEFAEVIRSQEGENT